MFPWRTADITPHSLGSAMLNAPVTMPTPSDPGPHLEKTLPPQCIKSGGHEVSDSPLPLPWNSVINDTKGEKEHPLLECWHFTWKSALFRVKRVCGFHLSRRRSSLFLERGSNAGTAAKPEKCPVREFLWQVREELKGNFPEVP